MFHLRADRSTTLSCKSRMPRILCIYFSHSFLTPDGKSACIPAYIYFSFVIPLKGLAQEKGTRILDAKDPGLSCQFFFFHRPAVESAANCQ